MVIDRFRAREREEASLAEPADANGDPAPERAEEELDRADVARHYAAFVASLEPVERGLFEARFRESLSVEATAQRLQLSEHHVKRGEKALKKRFFLAMKEHGFFEGFRYGRNGLERLAGTLVLFLGALR